MVALPCCHVTISVKRSDRHVRPALLNSLADHIKERRLDLGLQKKQLARQWGVDETTIHNCEDKGISPAIRFMPRILDFLGYDPTDGSVPESLAEVIRAHRTNLGLSRKRLATLFGIDQSNTANWETGKHLPTKRSLEVINEFLSVTVSQGNNNAPRRSTPRQNGFVYPISYTRRTRRRGDIVSRSLRTRCGISEGNDL
jgi:ribosome-binding protein aMBF1 (putative translation factor)